MDLFLQYAMKIAGTLFLLLLIGYLWSADIDVSKTLTAPLNWVLKFKKHHTFNFSNKQTVAVRFPSDGNIALVMYSIAIVNTLEESVTIKDVKLRYRLDGKPFITESLVLQTGSIVGSTEPALMLTTGGEPRVNIILMNWNNLRTEIGSYHTLQPGAILTGSALFVLGFKDVEDFSRVKNLEIVIVDFSGNETVQEIPVDPQWITNMRVRVMTVETRRFQGDGQQGIEYFN
jgi:hypothetical protein